MAMDSHDDSYRLLIDSENNNRKQKPNNFAADYNLNTECSSLIPYRATLSGSYKRKCSTLSKGFTIEEFLGTTENITHLTAIDRLLLKNKAALAEDQMKRARAKANDQLVVNCKTSDKNYKPNVLSGKVTSNKLKHVSNGMSKSKMNSKTNPKSKISNNVKRPKSVSKIDKNGLDGKKKPTLKKSSPCILKEVRNDKSKQTPLRKVSFNSSRKLKKEAKVNCKSFDMKILKNSKAYQTRSINTEKLRNGKKRIMKQSTEALSLENIKKRRSKESLFPRIRVKSVLKRQIKDEPRDVELASKKRKIVSSSPLQSINTKNTNSLPQVIGANNFQVKKEVKCEATENSNVFEINVNMNISPNFENPILDTLCTENVKSELVDFIPSNTVSVNADDATVENLDEQDACNQNLQIENDKRECDMSSTEELGDSSVEECQSDAAEDFGLRTTTDADSSRKSPDVLKKHDVSRDTIFNALGLQCIGRNYYFPPKDKETKDNKENGYTGTLKMVIKTEKGCRRMEVKQSHLAPTENPLNEGAPLHPSTTQIEKTTETENGCEYNYIDVSNANSSHDSSGMSSLVIEEDDNDEVKNGDVYNVPVVDSAKKAQHSDVRNQAVDDAKDQDNPLRSLVVPEKSSSFSIHPNRLCYDVCKYCFGKFGLLDTPCHVGTLKNTERQRKILSCEPNLSMDTCLCDACFRFVDRKANHPSKRKAMRPTAIHQRKVTCCVENCSQMVTKLYGRRKWRSKICRKIANLSFDIRRKSSGVLGLCYQHYCMLDMYTLCGICKKRLNRNDMFSIRSQLNELNVILMDDGIPANLVDNMLLCKSCHHCMSLRLNYGDPSRMSTSNREYYESFKKEIVYSRGLDKTNVKSIQKTENTVERCNGHLQASTNCHRSLSAESSANLTTKSNDPFRAISNNLEVLSINAKNAVASPSLRSKSLHPDININLINESNSNKFANQNESQLNLKADFVFENRDSSSTCWERCVSTIQFDRGTKKLWQDLQKPFGNQSSFIRHLIMLEKYWRCGALELSKNADAAAVKYINSVKNRIDSLETSSASTTATTTTASNSAKPSNETNVSMVLTTTTHAAPPPPIAPALSKPTNGPTEPSVRLPSAPPPLLKLNCLTSPFSNRKMTPVCAVKPSSDASSAKKTLPSLPALDKLVKTADKSAYFVEMPNLGERMYPAPQAPNKFSRMSVKSVPPHIVLKFDDQSAKNWPQHQRQQSVVQLNQMQFGPPIMAGMRNSSTMTNGSPVNISSSYPMSCKTNDKSSMSPQGSVGSRPIIFPKLPKGLTVRQVDDSGNQSGRSEGKTPSLIATPFLVGEKPSVSVFREISK